MNGEPAMTEKHIVIDEIDPRVLYGGNNTYMRMLKALYPKLRIVARDNVIKVMGEEKATAEFESTIHLLVSRCAKYNTIREADIIDIVKGRTPYDEEEEGVILYDIKGRPIRAKTENQQAMVRAYGNNDLMFVTGPAGSGKTYTAIALAVRAMKNKEVRRMVLSRPAVEAGEKLGFLPGDMKEKVDPYLRPLYDALEEMIQPSRLREMLEEGTIQIAPLAFMRGRTLADAVVILDEAQNTTSAQIKMFLTRMGFNTKMIVTGDRTQIDLPAAQRSGLEEALRVLRGVKGVSFVEMDKRDIVRNPLVTRIVAAYEKEAGIRKCREAEAVGAEGVAEKGQLEQEITNKDKSAQ